MTATTLDLRKKGKMKKRGKRGKVEVDFKFKNSLIEINSFFLNILKIKINQIFHQTNYLFFEINF